MKNIRIATAWLIVFICAAADADEWKPVEGNLLTRWAKEVSPQNVHPEYPRPQLVRDAWLNLNGLWELEFTRRGKPQPEAFSKQILVPFPVESALSGVKRMVGGHERVWYRRQFEVPKTWQDQRILLHFGAVDWHCEVWLNGKPLGVHRGGYDAFHFDITEALVPESEQELVVAVWDYTNHGSQPRGKQVIEPQGIWYTPTTGIWQTVWLEPVPKTYIAWLKIVPDVDQECVWVTANAAGDAADHEIAVRVALPENKSASGRGAPGKPVRVDLATDGPPRLWSPDAPYLYDLEVTLTKPGGEDAAQENEPADHVKSYFGMRKIGLAKDEQGITRLALNNEILFQIGFLDQGYWPGGVYAAPTDGALRYDVEMTKKLGFNLLRKHAKIEPSRWYYWCDKLGVLVWQDMPMANNRGEANRRQFRRELERLVDGRHNHPSIIMWIIFNETWGQHDTEELTAWIKKHDPTRLINSASGWKDLGVGDLRDVHEYPGPISAEPEPKRAAVLGEFGGLHLVVEGHTWDTRRRPQKDPSLEHADLARRYEELLFDVWRLKSKPGLSAAVYTQISDIENEINGLLTYDRAVLKIAAQCVAKANWGYLRPRIESEDEKFTDEATVRLVQARDDGRLRYTLDGTDPTPQSPEYRDPIPLTKTTTIKARSFWPDGKQSAVAIRTMTKVQPSQPPAAAK